MTKVGIVATMESVEAQTMSPDRRIVICDNCTDATPALARSRAGWEVWETVGNTGKKGGALNQAWDRLDGYLADDDYLVTMDADTLLDEHFVENAYAKYQRSGARDTNSAGSARTSRARARQRARRPAEDGVRARGDDQSLQARDRAGPGRRGDDVLGSRAARGPRFPRPGLRAGPDRGLRALARAAGPWLRHHGAAQLLPRTDLMPTVKMLWAQRLRWYRGAFESLRDYGFRKHVRSDIGWLIFSLWAAASRWLFLVALAIVLFQAGHMTFSPLLLPSSHSPQSSG